MGINKIAAAFTLLLLLSAPLLAQVKKTAINHKPHPASLSARMADGKIIYSKICVTCHMKDALGVQNMNPPLVKTTYVLGDKAKLISILLNGLNKTIEIDGDTYSNVMPSHDYLKDQEIADVLTYVRHSFGNKASAVTVAEVKKARAAKK